MVNFIGHAVNKDIANGQKSSLCIEQRWPLVDSRWLKKYKKVVLLFLIILYSIQRLTRESNEACYYNSWCKNLRQSLQLLKKYSYKKNISEQRQTRRNQISTAVYDLLMRFKYTFQHSAEPVIWINKVIIQTFKFVQKETLIVKRFEIRSYHQSIDSSSGRYLHGGSCLIYIQWSQRWDHCLTSRLHIWSRKSCKGILWWWDCYRQRAHISA